MTPRVARIILAALATVAALEWIFAALAYRALLTPAVWQQAADALAALPPDEPVFLGTTWLGPSARQHLPSLRAAASLAPPDLHGVPRFHVLGLAGSPHAGGWSDDLQADLGELPAPTSLGVDVLGPLRLHHYLAAAGTVSTDFLATPSALQLRDDRGPCRLSAETWSCKQGRIAIQILEIGYRPRRCLAVALEDGATLELIHPRAQLGTLLRGHLGFADFNARLRNDAPALLELFIDDASAGRWTLTDNQGWVAFAAPTSPGEHAVRLRLTPLLGGSWTEQGYGAAPRRTACIELRALTEANP